MSKVEDYEYKYVKHHMMEHPYYVPKDDDTITVAMLMQFRDTINIGDKFIIQVPKQELLSGTSYSISETVTILKKYPYVVETTSGFVQYLDLYQGIRLK